MFQNREYTPLLLQIVGKDCALCGGHRIHTVVQDNETKQISDLLSVFQEHDSKHLFIESFLPFFEREDDDHYLYLDYVYTVDERIPHILGNVERPILGLYRYRGVSIYDPSRFKQISDFYHRLLINMDNDTLRLIDDVLHYTKRIMSLRSENKSFRNDFIMVPFTLSTAWRTVTDIQVPFTLQHFHMENTENDNELLKVQYAVEEPFAGIDENLSVILGGEKKEIKTINLSFTDLCRYTETECGVTLFYFEKKPYKQLQKDRLAISKYWDTNKLELTELEKE